MKVICGWCQTVLIDGPPPVSHGICKTCMDKEMARLEPVKNKVDRKRVIDTQLNILDRAAAKWDAIVEFLENRNAKERNQ